MGVRGVSGSAKCAWAVESDSDSAVSPNRRVLGVSGGGGGGVAAAAAAGAGAGVRMGVCIGCDALGGVIAPAAAAAAAGARYQPHAVRSTTRCRSEQRERCCFW
jgi:hypothetical protein